MGTFVGGIVIIISVVVFSLKGSPDSDAELSSVYADSYSHIPSGK